MNEALVEHSKCFLINSTFYQNYGDNGGALRLIQNDINIINCNFIENAGSTFGGALYIYSKSINITSCKFMRNSAKRGGAIYFNNKFSLLKNEKEKILIYSSLFYFNIGNEGGCIYIYDNMKTTSSNYTKVYFFKNMGFVGGVLRITGESEIHSFLKCEFLSNMAEDGSGFYITFSATLIFYYSKFIANAAIALFAQILRISLIIFSYFLNLFQNPLYIPIITLDGLDLWSLNFKPNGEIIKTEFNSGLFVQESSSSSYFNFCNFKRNTAIDRGAVSLITCDGQLTANNSKFIENHSGGLGGVFDVEDKSKIFLENSIFFKNIADDSYKINNYKK